VIEASNPTPTLMFYGSFITLTLAYHERLPNPTLSPKEQSSPTRSCHVEEGEARH